MKDLALTEMGAFELAAAIRNKWVSPVEVVRAHQTRLREVNPSLNAMVEERFEPALDEARQAEARVMSGGDLPPLLGVPFSVKEAIALKGAPFTSGSLVRRGVRAERDATVVSRLRSAGAIPLGVTNISEMCMWMESDNLVYGRTGNPYDPGRTCGGSSGGEGAVVGAGGVPFGVGADVGGSIRLPSFFCGVFGHKPTGGLVPTTGHYPAPRAGARRIVTCGPICRRADDLMPLLRLMAGPDGADLSVLTDFEWIDCNSVTIRNMPILLCERLGGPVSSVEEELVESVHRAAAALERRGARLKSWTNKRTRQAFGIWAAAMSSAGEESFHALIGEGKPPNLINEWFSLIRGNPRHTLPALGLATLEKVVARLPSRGVGALIDQGKSLRREIEASLGNDGLLILPPYPRTAPLHHRAMLRPFDWVYTALWNALELPVTQVPVGLSRENVPLGVQLVASRRMDHVAIAGAQLLEKELGGWVPPSRMTRNRTEDQAISGLQGSGVKE